MTAVFLNLAVLSNDSLRYGVYVRTVVLIMYVEYVSLLQSCDVCDAASGSLSSYAYILMLLHYLQNVTPPVIPVLQQVNATISKPDPTDHAFT